MASGSGHYKPGKKLKIRTGSGIRPKRLKTSNECCLSVRYSSTGHTFQQDFIFNRKCWNRILQNSRLRSRICSPHSIIWNREMSTILECKVSDPHHINAVSDTHHINVDPDPAFHFNGDPDSTFSLSCGRIQILILIKVMQICDHLDYRISKALFEPPGLHCVRPRSSRAPFSASKASEFWLQCGPRPSFSLFCGSESSFPK